MMTQSKRDIFLSTYRHQNFTFPDSIMHYTAMNPKNSKVYLKTIKRCKYFFIKNPVLVFSELYYDQNEWKTWVINTLKNIDINRIKTKLWIADNLFVYPKGVSNDSVASSIIPKIYQCDAAYLILCDQIISLNELLFLCSSVKVLNLYRFTVKYDDGTVIAFEKMIEQLPKIERIIYTFANPSNNISKTTFKELWKIPHLSNYDEFDLHNIPENFDIESFYSFMKENKKTRVYLYFSDELSEEYKTRLEAIVDEIIATENHEYKPPFIEFPGLDLEKFFRMRAIYNS